MGFEALRHAGGKRVSSVGSCCSAARRALAPPGRERAAPRGGACCAARRGSGRAIAEVLDRPDRSDGGAGRALPGPGAATRVCVRVASMGRQSLRGSLLGTRPPFLDLGLLEAVPARTTDPRRRAKTEADRVTAFGTEAALARRVRSRSRS